MIYNGALLPQIGKEWGKDAILEFGLASRSLVLESVCFIKSKFNPIKMDIIATKLAFSSMKRACQSCAMIGKLYQRRVHNSTNVGDVISTWTSIDEEDI